MPKKLFGRFLRDETGSFSVETVIIFPILLWALGATFVFWDAFKAQNVNMKATYTIADMASREMAPITPEFIDGMADVFAFLTNGEKENVIRMTVIQLGLADDGVTPEYKFRWSRSSNNARLAPLESINGYENKLPILTVGDELILVETKMYWEPTFPIGLTEREMNQYVFMSPRFVPQVKFAGAETPLPPAGGPAAPDKPENLPPV